MDDFIPVYLQDVKDAINELESYFIDYEMKFENFLNDPLRRSAVERKTEIMGEAINRILKIKPDLPLPHAREIVNTRNRIIHAYDSVQPEFLWSLICRHIPILKEDVEKLLKLYGIED